MAVVTFAGTLGSGAREIALALAERLGMDYVDQQILVDAAGQLGVTVELLAERDERTLGFRDRLANLMRSFLQQSAAAGAADPLAGTSGLEVLLARTYGEAAEEPSSVDDTLYAKTLTGIIQSLAQRENAVIVGRGGQAILAGHPRSFHAAVTAPLPWRTRVVTQREGVLEEQAKKMIHEFDKQRAAFHRKFFKVNVDDPALYDLVLNGARFTTDEAVTILAQVVACCDQRPR